MITREDLEQLALLARCASTQIGPAHGRLATKTQIDAVVRVLSEFGFSHALIESGEWR